MPAPGEKPCKDCGQTFDPAKLSWQGLCRKCSQARLKEVHRQLQERAGPYYEKWKWGFKRAGLKLK